MEKKYLIVGHGLAGCVLALTFYRRGIPFKIIGSTLPGESSMASSGLITPVTGRRYVKAWMIDELIEKALEFYQWTESWLGNDYFFPVEVVKFLSNNEAFEAWNKRAEDVTYASYISNKKIEVPDKLGRPYGILTGGFRLDTPAWLNAVRGFLMEKGLLEIRLEPITDDIVETEPTIYATGAVGKPNSAGIIPNKGEALIVKIPGWNLPCIMKDEVYFIPLREKDMYWVGSYYLPWPEDTLPSIEGKTLLLKSISEVCPEKFEVIDHVTGVRPTVDDRRPVIGPYPGYPGKFLFNGMGTKGTSLAPYWADQLVSHLVDGLPLPKIVNPSRYSTLTG